MIEEKFIFTGSTRRKIIIVAAVGLALLVIGIVLSFFGGHGEAAEGGHGITWVKRILANLWINNVYFTGIAVIGVFFVALQYITKAGWSVAFIRVPQAFGYWLPIAFVLMIIVFLVGKHDLFHWTHHELFEPFLEDGKTPNPAYDKIIAGKEPYLNIGFYLFRMFVYFVLWYGFFLLLKKHTLAEDIEGGTIRYRKIVKLSAIFTVIFAITSSTSAWDWVLSVDTHWFSTMIGWYVFSSWFVSGLAAITFLVIILRESGYLPSVNANHLHDLGKLVFAFSIFWTYIWFSQFLLIYYANIPEETIYFIERLRNDPYTPVFFINLIFNFFFPFLVLMTRASKRHSIFLKIVCPIVLVGHWLDFYLMITPGIMTTHGGLGFIEIGLAMIYGAGFVFVILLGLAKVPLVAKNHPMLEESIHHHVM